MSHINSDESTAKVDIMAEETKRNFVLKSEWVLFSAHIVQKSPDMSFSVANAII